MENTELKRMGQNGMYKYSPFLGLELRMFEIKKEMEIKNT